MHRIQTHRMHSDQKCFFLGGKGGALLTKGDVVEDAAGRPLRRVLLHQQSRQLRAGEYDVRHAAFRQPAAVAGFVAPDDRHGGRAAGRGRRVAQQLRPRHKLGQRVDRPPVVLQYVSVRGCRGRDAKGERVACAAWAIARMKELEQTGKGGGSKPPCGANREDSGICSVRADALL